MPDYRRAFNPGGTFFFTLVTHQRKPLFADPRNVQPLRASVALIQRELPFEIGAAVILPDHLHWEWTLPEEDSDYSKRIGKIKVAFTKALRGEGGGGQCPPYSSRIRKREADIWQRRFWEHVIRDDADLQAHRDYIHYNPVKHGYVRCPHAWKYSSFSKYVRAGAYEPNWCCSCDNRVVKPPRCAGVQVKQLEFGE